MGNAPWLAYVHLETEMTPIEDGQQVCTGLPESRERAYNPYKH
jgi:hypothetical protein